MIVLFFDDAAGCVRSGYSSSAGFVVPTFSPALCCTLTEAVKTLKPAPVWFPECTGESAALVIGLPVVALKGTVAAVTHE